MKIIISLIVAIFFGQICFGQIYSGESRTGNSCILKLNSDSTLVFTGYKKGILYVEYSGTIKNIIGNIYEISWQLNFIQSGVMPGHPINDNYFQVYIDPVLDFSKDLGFLKIKYSGKTEVFKSRPNPHAKFYYRKKDIKIQGIATIETNHKNPITGEPLTVKVQFGTDPTFGILDHPETFRIIWTGDTITSLSELPVEFYGFKLNWLNNG